MYTISDLKTDATNHLHGTNLNKVPGVYSLIFEAGRNVLNQIDVRETKKISTLTNAVYDDVYNYACPADLKGRKIVDIRPQTGQEISDEMYQWYSADFNQYKENIENIFAIQDNSGTKSLKISKELSEGVTLHTVNSLTDNGTWGASGNASGLVADTVNKVSGSASLRFTITASGSVATITNSTMSSVDTSEYEDMGSIFVWVYFSAVTPITSVKLSWGSDSSNYWHRTVTTTHEGNSFAIGWNLLRFDWDGANEVSSPDSTAVDYLKLDVNYDGTAVTTVRFDNIVLRLPTLFDIEYYSKYLFKTSAGVWVEKPTDDTDIINLDTEAYNLILYEFLALVAQVVQGEEASFDLQYFEKKRDEAWNTYRSDNKSEAKRPETTYYRQLYTRRR